MTAPTNASTATMLIYWSVIALFCAIAFIAIGGMAWIIRWGWERWV